MTLSDDLARLHHVPAQQRGRDFERFLRRAMSSGGIHPSLSFRPAGEEVDGSFWWQGRTYLVEAKWTADPIPASSIYMFKGKVDGKLTGTIGAFVSWAGTPRMQSRLCS